MHFKLLINNASILNYLTKKFNLSSDCKDDILMSNFFDYAEEHFIDWADASQEFLPTISMRADSGIFYQEAVTTTKSEMPLLFGN